MLLLLCFSFTFLQVLEKEEKRTLLLNIKTQRKPLNMLSRDTEAVSCLLYVNQWPHTNSWWLTALLFAALDAVFLVTENILRHVLEILLGDMILSDLSSTIFRRTTVNIFGQNLFLVVVILLSEINMKMSIFFWYAYTYQLDIY